jgi:carbamoyltransferase
MPVLGITDGQTSGAAITHEGRILAAVNEERIVRLKLARGFPYESIREVLRLAGTQPSDIEAVGIAGENMELREQIAGWPGWFEARGDDADVHSAFFKLASRYGSLVPRLPGLKTAYYGLRTPVFRRRRSRIAQMLALEFDVHAPIQFLHHHYAHAASAYYTSGFDRALVITLDGGGDRHSSHVYDVQSGRFRLLSTVDSYDSLGNYYAYVTALCGFKAKLHEGKITGLAAHGQPIYRDLFDSMIGLENGRTVNRGKVLFNAALEKIRQHLPEHWKLEDLAATIQVVAEDVARGYVQHWISETGHTNVALAGGVFANVRINEEIHRIGSVENVFVHPGMSDEGLAVGAALALEGERTLASGRAWTQRPLPDVYLGPEYSERDISAAVERAGLKWMYYAPGGIEHSVADRLAAGNVVARFHGRMEYGPRALGNRSILYQPGDPSVNDWLNELLRRTEFMPFAPSTLYEAADECYECVQGAEDTARFMTITFHCKPRTVEECSGVVHVDGTARPQLVRRQDNPSYYRIIDEYRKRTGIPTIVNTSFNIHEEPIVRSPDDALRAFIDSALDYLAIGDFLVEGPLGSAVTRAKWEGRSKWGSRRWPELHV